MPRYYRGYCRVFGWFALLCLAVVLTSVGLFRAGLAKALLMTTEHVMRFSDAKVQDAPRPMLLNGQRLFLSTGRSAKSVSEIVKSYARECENYQRELFGMVFKGHFARWMSERALFQPLQSLGDGKGVVVCLKLDPRIKTRDEFMSTAQRVLKTGQIGELFSLRYMAAHAGKQHTFFNTVWTDQTLDLAKMFPETKDAPGPELMDIPRPPHSRRVIDFGEAGHPERLVVYLADQNAGSLYVYYDKSMIQRGWERIGQGEPRIYAMDGHVAVVGYNPLSKTQGHVTIFRTD